MTKNQFLEKRIQLLSDLLQIDTNKYRLDYDFYSLAGGYNLVIVEKKSGGQYGGTFEKTRVKYKEFLTYINGLITSLEFNRYCKNFTIHK